MSKIVESKAMAIKFDCLKKEGVEAEDPNFSRVDQIAKKLRSHLDSVAVQQEIKRVHQVNAHSGAIQNIILKEMTALGFENEKKKLFANAKVKSLRPDYYCRVGSTGILLEVERGKTIMNNMDLLDLWKCHICDHADYLFLLVPEFRPNKKGKKMKTFEPVKNRLGMFFEPSKYVNVNAVYIFGY